MSAKNGLDRFPMEQLASWLKGAEAGRTFVESLAEAMHEVARICKPDGRMVFTYRNLAIPRHRRRND